MFAVGDQSTRDGSGVGKRKRHGIVEEVDEEEDGLSKEEKHVTSLLMKAFGKTSVITDQDNSIPPTERLESVRQAHLLMKDVRTILLDPDVKKESSLYLSLTIHLSLDLAKCAK